MRSRLLAAAAVLATAALAPAADYGLTKGTPEIKSISALAFGPDGILFVGDPQSATIFAIDTGDKAAGSAAPINLDQVNVKLAGLLGVTPADISVADLKVNPASGTAYLAVGRGKSAAAPAVVTVSRTGELKPLATKDVMFSKVAIPNPGAGKGRDGPAGVITSMAFVDGRVIVAGLSSEEFASTLRAIPFPFKDADKGAGIEIFHGAHGKIETASPIRTFTPYKLNGEDTIMAAYTCTPLVKIPVKDLKAGAKVKGTTIAELGNRNQPLDMIVYSKDGKDYILMANSARGVMKIPAEGFASATAITARPAGDTAGVKYETIKELQGVMQLDKLDAGHALLLVKAGDALNLKTIALP
jgi:hypothetical protein